MRLSPSGVAAMPSSAAISVIVVASAMSRSVTPPASWLEQPDVHRG